MKKIMLLSLFVVISLAASEDDRFVDLRIAGEFYDVVVEPHRNTRMPSSNVWEEWSDSDSTQSDEELDTVVPAGQSLDDCEDCGLAELFSEPDHADGYTEPQPVKKLVLPVPVPQSDDEEETIFVVENTQRRKYRRAKVFFTSKQAKLNQKHAREEYGRARNFSKLPKDLDGFAGNFQPRLTPRQGFKQKYSLQEIFKQEEEYDREVDEARQEILFTPAEIKLLCHE